MKKNLVILFLCSTLISCFGRYEDETKISSILPKSFHTLLKINTQNDIKGLSKNLFLSKDLHLKPILKYTELFKESSLLYIAISDSTFLFISEKEKNTTTKDSLSIAKNLKTEESEIFKTNIDGDSLYNKKIGHLLLSSNKKDNLVSIKIEENPEFEKLLSTLGNDASASVIFNDSEKKNSFLQTHKKQKGYQVIDINLIRNEINYSGIEKSKDSSYYLNAFVNTKPQEFKISKIIPDDTQSFKRIAFDNFKTFKFNLEKNTSEDDIRDVFTLSNEIALIKTKNQSATVISVLDAELIKDVFSNETIADTFKGISIIKIKDPDYFKTDLTPFFKIDTTNYSFIYENFVVFSDKISTLKSIITSKLNNKTLSESQKFQSLSNSLANESSYIIYKNDIGLSKFLGSEPEGFNANAVQYIYDTDFAHVNGVFSKFKKQGAKNSITDDFIVNIPNDILIAPQVVKSRKGKSYTIVTQDVNNILYAISNSGNILWTKQLTGPVIGKIKTIDSNKNGLFQLTFATQNKVHLLDSRGNTVGKFPLKFKNNITQPLSVFDYDQRKNYRLLVTQGKELIMYDAKGKIVSGFKYPPTANTISSQPKHFRINTKDYIVFACGKKLQIISRQGKTRVKVNTDISFSGNDIYLYKNKFTTLSKTGQLTQIDTKGNVTNKNENFSSETFIATTSKTLVALTDNILKIKSKTVDLDFGNYSPPKIFYLQDKIYVTTTDLQTKKVYLFDSQAKSIDNFPIFGTASAELQNIDFKRDLELVTQTDPKTIIVYKIN